MKTLFNKEKLVIIYLVNWQHLLFYFNSKHTFSFGPEKPSQANWCNILVLKRGSNFRASVDIILFNDPWSWKVSFYKFSSLKSKILLNSPTWIVWGFALEVRPLNGDGNAVLVPGLTHVLVSDCADFYFGLNKAFLNKIFSIYYTDYLRLLEFSELCPSWWSLPWQWYQEQPIQTSLGFY